MKNINDAIKLIKETYLSMYENVIKPFFEKIPSQIETLNIMIKKEPVLSIGIAIWLIGFAIKLFKIAKQR